MQATAWDFQNRLLAILNSARHSGKAYVDVDSGRLHARAGEEPNLLVCCDVMRQLMRAGDSVVTEPVNGQDTTLTIRYIV